MRIMLRRVVLLLSAMGLAAGGYVVYTNNATEGLYAEAIAGTAGSRSALKKLAAHKGKHTTMLLLQIARRDGDGDVTDDAFNELQRRSDPEIAVDLSRMLQPHQGLGSRRGVAEALKDRACPGECLASVLHYLERTSRGDANEEDLRVFPAGAENLRASDVAEQQQLNRDLYVVSKRNRADTLNSLREIYGLASIDPSLFALDLVSRLNLREACLLLLESKRQMKEQKSEYNRFPEKELQAAISSVPCE
jgi:hypothetical protein